MNKLYIFKDTVTLFGSLLHLQRRKPLPVKGSKTAGCIDSSQIAAQHHFVFGNITIVRQQLQISTVVRYILLSTPRSRRIQLQLSGMMSFHIC